MNLHQIKLTIIEFLVAKQYISPFNLACKNSWHLFGTHWGNICLWFWGTFAAKLSIDDIVQASKLGSVELKSDTKDEIAIYK
jgi:hypothetical protein